MSAQGHIESLVQRHKELDRRIVEMSQSPTIDHLGISDLKKKKLVIKDELERFKGAPEN